MLFVHAYFQKLYTDYKLEKNKWFGLMWSHNKILLNHVNHVN